MLTKNEINIKKGKFPDSSSDSDASKNVPETGHNKRRFLIVSIIATVGLSFVFWSYRQFSSILSQPLPSLTFPSVYAPSLDTPNSLIAKIISQDSSRWNISVDHGPIFNWSGNTDVFDHQAVSSRLLSSKKKSIIIKEYLPQGLDIYENYQEDSSKLLLEAVVVTPKKNLVFIVTIEGINLSSSKLLLPDVVSNLYWLLIKD